MRIQAYEQVMKLYNSNKCFEFEREPHGKKRFKMCLRRTKHVTWGGCAESTLYEKFWHATLT